MPPAGHTHVPAQRGGAGGGRHPGRPREHPRRLRLPRQVLPLTPPPLVPRQPMPFCKPFCLAPKRHRPPCRGSSWLFDACPSEAHRRNASQVTPGVPEMSFRIVPNIPPPPSPRNDVVQLPRSPPCAPRPFLPRNAVGVSTIEGLDRAFTAALLSALVAVPSLTVLGPTDAPIRDDTPPLPRLPVISFVVAVPWDPNRCGVLITPQH